MKNKGYCKYCKKLESHKKILNVKKEVGPWILLLFDLPCKKCGKTTFQLFKAMVRILGEKKPALKIQAVYSVPEVSFVDVIEECILKKYYVSLFD